MCNYPSLLFLLVSNTPVPIGLTFLQLLPFHILLNCPSLPALNYSASPSFQSRWWTHPSLPGMPPIFALQILHPGKCLSQVDQFVALFLNHILWLSYCSCILQVFPCTYVPFEKVILAWRAWLSGWALTSEPGGCGSIPGRAYDRVVDSIPCGACRR